MVLWCSSSIFLNTTYEWYSDGHYSKIKHSATKGHNSNTEEDFSFKNSLAFVPAFDIVPEREQSTLSWPSWWKGTHSIQGFLLSILRSPFSSPWLLLLLITIIIIFFALFRNNAPYSTWPLFLLAVDNTLSTRDHGIRPSPEECVAHNRTRNGYCVGFCRPNWCGEQALMVETMPLSFHFFSIPPYCWSHNTTIFKCDKRRFEGPILLMLYSLTQPSSPLSYSPVSIGSRDGKVAWVTSGTCSKSFCDTLDFILCVTKVQKVHWTMIQTPYFR